ncbi:MAG: endolytic transglycosylase MltG [Eubacteriales bacterium]|nr:endolytic transglycosylase MltG [Eubacteriales bacterium]
MPETKRSKKLPSKKKRESEKNYLGIKISSSMIKYIVYIALFFIMVYMVKEAYSVGYRIFDQTAAEKSPGRDVQVTVTEGMTVTEVGKMLEEKGVIKSQFTFRLQEWFTGYHGRIKSGTYTVNTSYSPETILAILSVDTEYLEQHQIGVVKQ